jgi:hypothetical protein
MKYGLVEVHLAPLERDELAHAKPVPVGEQEHGRVAVPVASALARRRNEPLDLGLDQVLAGAAGGVGLPERWSNSPVYVV